MTETSGRRPWGEAIGTLALVAALGPPIGGLVFALEVAVVPSLGALATKANLEGDAPSIFLVTVFVALFAIPFSYFVGIGQAAAAGLAFAVYGWLRGRPPFWFAVVTGLLVYAGAMVAGYSGVEEWFMPFLMIHLIPVLVCWLIVRLFWSAQAS
jgi:hypothetical protein